MAAQKELLDSENAHFLRIGAEKDAEIQRQKDAAAQKTEAAEHAIAAANKRQREIDAEVEARVQAKQLDFLKACEVQIGSAGLTDNQAKEVQILALRRQNELQEERIAKQKAELAELRAGKNQPLS